MADFEIYARQLLVKRHGYPLFIPEPDGPTIYQTKGVRIGDVGYVTRSGGFLTLFNIRASPGDPINWRGVPDGFQQIHLDPRSLSRFPNFQPPNSVVASSSAKQGSLGAGLSAVSAQAIVGASAALQYVWTSAEGAILHLPKGASRVDAVKRIFQEQAMRHAESWYDFASKCSDVSNGALYLVTGCDKTNSWMVGAFSNHAAGSQVVLQLSAVAGALGGQISYNYSWDSLSPPGHRVGPSSEGIAAVAGYGNLDDLSRDDEVFGEDNPGGGNQCTFIRGYKITLRTDLWSRLLASAPQVTSIEDVTKADVKLNASTNPAPVSASHSKGKGKAFASRGGRDPSGVQESGNRSPSDKGAIVLEEIPGSFEGCHPSTLINNFMLERYADAEVAITHDDDWVRLIDEEDQSLPTDDELLFRLQRRNAFVLCDNGIWPIRNIPLLTSDDGQSSNRELVETTDALGLSYPQTWPRYSLPSIFRPLPPIIAPNKPSSLRGLDLPKPQMTVKIHPALEHTDIPLLKYDMSCHPSTLSLVHSSLSPALLSEAATRPPLPSITLVSQCLPWKLEITPNSGQFVTVSDIINGMYRALRTTVSQAEYAALPSPAAQQRVTDAYRRRYARILDSSARQVEMQEGLKRIDFFGELNRFMGLSSTPLGPHVWSINGPLDTATIDVERPSPFSIANDIQSPMTIFEVPVPPDVEKKSTLGPTIM